MKPYVISSRIFRELWETHPLPAEKQFELSYSAHRLSEWRRRLGRVVRLEPNTGFSPNSRTIMVRVMRVSVIENSRVVVLCYVMQRTSPDRYIECIVDYLDSIANSHAKRVGRLEAACEELQNKIMQLDDIIAGRPVRVAGLLRPRARTLPALRPVLPPIAVPPPYRSPSVSPSMEPPTFEWNPIPASRSSPARREPPVGQDERGVLIV